MGNAIKRWLGIERLTDRVAALTKLWTKTTADVEQAKSDAFQAALDAKKALEVALDCQKLLTQQPAKRKIETKRPNWRTFRAQAEKATDTEEA